MQTDFHDDMALEAEIECFAHRWFSLRNRNAPAATLAELIAPDATIRLLGERRTVAECLDAWASRDGEILLSSHAPLRVRSRRKDDHRVRVALSVLERTALRNGDVRQVVQEQRWELDIASGDFLMTALSVDDIRDA
ncbi:hypothetical protein FIU83_05465 [Halomonas sp. THAF5a]|uniref:hypothetical protein n=1 Tax=Halomonas sp. THAF5a TaxID=2587844 RepID=UPI0012686EF3|nr:hypothetical protein [Halomonas sp. THAF5a]QFU01080.1 hypothetical protein FIU83_05465 [Halomonas sp. THAF5a]